MHGILKAHVGKSDHIGILKKYLNVKLHRTRRDIGSKRYLKLQAKAKDIWFDIQDTVGNEFQVVFGVVVEILWEIIDEDIIPSRVVTEAIDEFYSLVDDLDIIEVNRDILGAEFKERLCI